MHKKALTLIEILVSVVILALVITGMANLFVSGKRWLLHSRSRMTGAELGKLFVEPLQMDVRQDTWNTSCVANTSNCPPASVNTTQTLDKINYTATYNSSNVTGVPTLRRVQVTINWTEPSP